MYAKSFELGKLKRLISENYGRTQRISDTAFAVKSSKKFIVSIKLKTKSHMVLKISSYPIEYFIMVFPDTTVRDIIDKLVYRGFLVRKSTKAKRKKLREAQGITLPNST